jgi:hypothetical protein
VQPQSATTAMTEDAPLPFDLPAIHRILSLLGQYNLLTIDQFDKYVDQLARRVWEHPE